MRQNVTECLTLTSFWSLWRTCLSSAGRSSFTGSRGKLSISSCHTHEHADTTLSNFSDARNAQVLAHSTASLLNAVTID